MYTMKNNQDMLNRFSPTSRWNYQIYIELNISADKLPTLHQRSFDC